MGLPEDDKDAIEEKSSALDRDEQATRYGWLPTLRSKGSKVKAAIDGENMDHLEPLPQRSSSIFSRISFHWASPLLILGFRRPLEKSDLWKLPDDLLTGQLADQLEEAIEGRGKKIAERNQRAAAVPEKSLRRRWWKVRSRLGLGSADGQTAFGITKAIYLDHRWIAPRIWLWIGIKVVADLMQVLSVLITRYMISYGADKYNAAPGQGPPIAHGIGAALGLFFMLSISTTLEQHYFMNGWTCGTAVRSAICDTIFRRALRFTNRSRGQLPNSRLITHISADASRLELVTGFGPMAFTATVQVLAIVILLIIQLGVAALAGIAIMLITVPFQFAVMRTIHRARSKAIKFTDARIKVTQEAISNAKAIKLFAWEESTIAAAQSARKGELAHLRTIYLVKAANASMAAAVPVIATIIAFAAYAHVNGEDGRSPASIFSSLLLFNLMRLPLGMLPLALGEVADSKIAMKRLALVFQAETLDDVSLNVDDKAEYAIEVQKAQFVWEAPPPEAVAALSAKKLKKAKRNLAKGKTQAGVATPIAQHPSGLHDISLQIPHGQLCAIVGQVGSGKSSLINALIGEMKRTSGDVKFGGRIAYSPQIAWLQSATIRENILFGSEYDEKRYNQVIHDACLETDLVRSYFLGLLTLQAMFPYGDRTEIGEKGITLSGGQRQRVGIARCLYATDRSIVLLDDPLSALDAHVGKTLFDRAINGSLKGKTRLLVTNAIHVLPQCDYILVLNEGRIVERGSYADLISRNGQLAHLVTEFASKKVEAEETEPKDAIKRAPKQEDDKIEAKEGAHKHMQDEERNRGSVTWRTWAGYFTAARAQVIFLVTVLIFAVQQGAQITDAQVLVWWQRGPGGAFDKDTSFYLSLYAGLGVGSALILWIVLGLNAMTGYRASTGLHAQAIRRVLYAPLSFFESTPNGRILSRFAKDLDAIDSVLADNTRMCWLTFMAVITAITLIAIQEPYFLIAVFAMLTLDGFLAWFYRHAGRELKRLDNVLRSAFTAHFAESLSGLASIRAYGETDKFIVQNERLIDRQNCAVYMVWASQRWLGFRLDQSGAILVLVVALIVVCRTFNPAQIGLALSYIVSVQPSLSWGTHVLCETETSFNSVERVLHYANELEQEAASEIVETKPPASWPAQGSIVFENVEMAYRPDLPKVLRSLNLEVRPGESLGICGRTGAGKSSILTTLLRLVEPSGGRILIDGVDISTIGLHDLRRAVAVLPQDASLFAGTLRYNLDPYGQHDEAKLNDALRRSHLNSKISNHSRTSLDSADESTGRYSLDSRIESDGSNLSIGERSLVSLARALVKDARIVCLDEATASVDLATDEMIQNTIATDFEGRTILSIAHRLKTLLAYDRILVLDAGKVAELDTPAALFAANGIFRELCTQSSISAKDIDAAQAERQLRRSAAAKAAQQ